MKKIILLVMAMMCLSTTVMAQPWPKKDTGWVQDSTGTWVQEETASSPKKEKWVQDANGTWVRESEVVPPVAQEKWVQDASGTWVRESEVTESKPEIVAFSASADTENLPFGVTELTFSWTTNQAKSVYLKYGNFGNSADSETVQLTLNGWTTVTAAGYYGSDPDRLPIYWTDYDYIRLVAVGENGEEVSQELSVACDSNAWFFKDALLLDECPDRVIEEAQMAYQSFENGFMIWHEDEGIFVVRYDGTYTQYFEDEWKDWQPEDSSSELTAPEGLVKPIRGFGLVWDKYNLQDSLGWGVTSEVGYMGITQCMRSGSFACYTTSPEANKALAITQSGWSWFNY